MRQRGETEIWITPSFRCYSFESRFHGWLVFSLHRRPDLPLNGAHVSHEQFNFRWPLPQVIGSPDLEVLSASLTSARSSDVSCLVRLVGSYKLGLNLTDLPCSHGTL